jgi:hypothetical protein
MQIEPQAEHKWLRRLVGEWTMEAEAEMEPGKPPQKFKGTESVRMLGELWTIGEGVGEGPSGGESRSIMTLGYDPQRKRFVGTFISSMMSYLWPYDGALDATKKMLTLDSEGPNFEQTGLAPYQDIIEWHSDDHRTLSSQIRTADGKWMHFMTAHYRRQK